mgnify:FL=1
MAPKVVDKNEKRREIALSCHQLIHDKGIRNITIAQVAKTAGIGKGTVYEYFENKDDIVFEIINMHIEQYHNAFLETIKDVKNTREKVYHFFKFVLDDSEENMKHFNGFKDYLSIMLADENEAMSDYNGDCHTFFNEQLKKVISEGVNSGELIPQALEMSNGLLIFEKGLVLLKMTQKDYDTKKECELFIDSFFDLIEIKK